MRKLRAATIIFGGMLVLHLGTGSAMADRSFSVLVVNDYVAPPELSGGDLSAELDQAGDYVDNYLIGKGWIRDQHEHDTAVAADDFTDGVNGASASSLAFSWTHSESWVRPADTWDSVLSLAYWNVADRLPKEQALYIKDAATRFGAVQDVANYPSKWLGDDSANSKDLEWIVSWGCDWLQADNWKWAFDGGMNLWPGYYRHAWDDKPLDVMSHFMPRLFGDAPYTKPYTVWSSYILANQDFGTSGNIMNEDEYADPGFSWDIMGYLNHRYDYMHNVTPPAGQPNYTATEYYYPATSMYRWYQQIDYVNSPQLVADSGNSAQSATILGKLWHALKSLVQPEKAIADTKVVLAGGKVSFPSSLRSAAPDSTAFRIQLPRVDLGSLADGVLDGGGAVTETAGGMARHDAQRDLVAEANGFVAMSSELAGITAKNLDYGNAKAQSDAFISRFGGLPQGYVLTTASTVEQEEVDAGSSETIARSFRYLPVIEGVPVVGAGGPGITITVADQGVMYASRWTPALVPVGPKAPVLRADEAIARAADRLPTAFGKQTVEIGKAEFVYFSPSYSDEGVAEKEVRPAWRLSPTSGDSAFIDAITGEIIGAPVSAI